MRLPSVLPFLVMSVSIQRYSPSKKNTHFPWLINGVPRRTLIILNIFSDNRRVIIRIVVLLSLFILGCKREDPQPELSDPIFVDLVHQHESAEREVANLAKDLESSQKELVTADKQNGEIKIQRSKMFDFQEKLDKARQYSKFLHLEVERRRAFARKSYSKAFEKDEVWPDPAELRMYQANKRLVEAPKSYDETHRQRLQDRKPANSPGKPKSAPSH